MPKNQVKTHSNLVKRGNTKSMKRKKYQKTVNDEELKFLEKLILGSGNEIFDESKSEVGDRQKKNTEANEEFKKPAWIDEDDKLQAKTGSKHQLLRRKQGEKYRQNKFHQVSSRPNWASYSKTQSPQDSILTQCGKLLKKAPGLNPYFLKFKKLKDLNIQSYSEGSINAIQFHPSSTIGMVAGLSGVVSLYEVNGKENTKIQSMQFQSFPIYSACFLKKGEELMIGSKNRTFFHCFNLMTGQLYKVNNHKVDNLNNMGKFIVSPNYEFIVACGKYGKIHILSAKTKEVIDHFQMNCEVGSITFHPDGSKLYSHGSDGEVYIWDMNTRRCIQKFIDEGCLQGTAIDVSPNGAYIACGSSSGIVNIYDSNDLSSNTIKPIKCLYNMVTCITGLKYNPTSEILSVSSNLRQNSIKFVHMPSLTVFSNFPNSQAKYINPNCIDFSPNSGYFAIGDSSKVAHLHHLSNYGNY